MKLSQDPITATLLAHSVYDAELARFIYEDNVEELPEMFAGDAWAQSLSYPVELYFIFPNKRKYGKFMRELSTALTEIEVIASY